MSPLHQLGHAQMFLCCPPAVTLATKLARPIRNLLLLLHNSWEWRKQWVNKSQWSQILPLVRASMCLPWTEPSMLQLQFSRSCVREGVSVRLKRSRSSLVEKLVWSAPLPRSTTVPESPCLDTCLWKIRSSIVPARKEHPDIKLSSSLCYMMNILRLCVFVYSDRLWGDDRCAQSSSVHLSILEPWPGHSRGKNCEREWHMCTQHHLVDMRYTLRVPWHI